VLGSPRDFRQGGKPDVSGDVGSRNDRSLQDRRTRNETVIKTSEFFRNVAKSKLVWELNPGGALRQCWPRPPPRGDGGMEVRATGDIFLFGDFCLDRGGLLRRDERDIYVPVAIGSRALDLLGVLVERPGSLISKGEMIAAVWPGIVVEDSNLTVQISALRRVLDQGRAERSCIQTVAGRGYRFVATVTRRTADADSAIAVISRGGGRPPPRLSIVVMPFTNLSNDSDHEYFADGLTDDLTTDLSRISGSFVIARSTAFTYKGKAIDAKQIGRELGVRYVLEGSIRRSGHQIRANAQLIDAESDAHLWAERFDRDTGDLFALQDEITSRIAVALDLELIGAEAGRPIERPDVLDYILRGRAAYSRPLARDHYAEAISLFERALTLDPRSVEAQSWLAHALAGRMHFRMTDSAAADIERAEGLVRRALAASPRNPIAHYAKGQLLLARSRPEEAIPEFETVIASNRNWVYALYALGTCKLVTGSIEETIPLVEQAIRLSPRDPFIANWYTQIGRAHLVQSRTDEAILWLEKALGANPGLWFAHAPLAAAYALKGEPERAAAELAEARRLSGDGRFASIASLEAARYWGVPKIRALFEATFFAGLRKAGMPEE
jgi:TolB-like protein/Tfp pilus assembly protein PilF